MSDSSERNVLEPPLHARVLGRHLGRLLLVVPEPLGAHLLLERGDALALAERGQR